MAKVKNGIKVIVKPATDNAYREGYAKANGKVIPYDVPVIVEESDLKVLERMKEPKKVNDKTIDVHKIMNDLRITQEKANRIARIQERENTGRIRYVNKYIVKVV